VVDAIALLDDGPRTIDPDWIYICDPPTGVSLVA